MPVTSRIKYILSCIFLNFLSYAVIAQATAKDKSDLVAEIRKVEKQFQDDLNQLGAEVAFEKYAAPNAVIKRQNDSLVYGQIGIKLYYSNEIYKSAKAYWSPDYIDISQDGTFAYTYGKYQWKMTGKDGEVHEFSGVFHTVWKKQPGGTWKYVWD